MMIIIKTSNDALYKLMRIVYYRTPISDHCKKTGGKHNQQEDGETISGNASKHGLIRFKFLFLFIYFLNEARGHLGLLIHPDTTVNANVHVGLLFMKTSRKTQTAQLTSTEPSPCQRFFR